MSAWSRVREDSEQGVRAVAQGRHEIFSEIFAAYHPKLLHFIKRNEICRCVADDLVQDTFRDAWRKFDILADHENIGGWLMQNLKNKMRNYIRDRHRFEIALTEDMAEPDNFVGDLITKNQLAAVWEFINTNFKPDDIHLLKRIIVDEAGHNVVSKEQGITIWTSQKRLERIRKRIREEFPDF